MLEDAKMKGVQRPTLGLKDDQEFQRSLKKVRTRILELNLLNTQKP